MKKINKLLSMFLLLALLLVPARAAQAKGLSDGPIFGSNYTLKSGETLNSDIVLIGGNALIETKATVNGNIVLIGGNATIESDANINGDVVLVGGNVSQQGNTSGDVVVIGGQVTLGANSVVGGDVATIGGQLSREDGSQVKGDIVNGLPQPKAELPNPPVVPNLPTAPNPPSLIQPAIKINFDPLTQAVSTVFQSLAVAALAMLVVVFLQSHVERVGHAITSQPLVSGSLGLLTVVLAPLVLVILVITIILIPVAILGVFLLAFAWLFGMIALGQEIGERFTHSIHQTWAPVLTTGFGAFLLMFVLSSLQMLNFVPGLGCVTWIPGLLIGLMGLGGSVMTWFGSRPMAFVKAPVFSTSNPSAGPGSTLPPAS